jgi:hypothetical protein
MIMCLDVIGFIERLMRVMFHVYFNAGLWKIFVELSYFYRQICAKKVSKAMMERLEEEIAMLICIMEKSIPSRMLQCDAAFTSPFTLGSDDSRTCAVQVDE